MKPEASDPIGNRQSPIGNLSAIDADNPWPGLATFTEDQRAYFHGRDEEIIDLTQLAERRPLVVLFGQSGLGKSSILQAGVFPRLRTDGFCPIYIRLDHSEGAPSPTEQIKEMVRIETAKWGTWTKPGSAKPGETLWEFFHHRDDRLVDRDGLGVVPVLVFDQFEELFTLGAARSERRERAVAFIRELAELVENRPSAQLVARLEQSAEEMDAFDFSRTDYRVIISLREDFLPDLESLKTIMPALMQKRMRLTRLNGTQALDAVLKPGGALVDAEVARAIVEFVAGARGGSAERLAEIDVEPALLSVVCRELNERRRANGQPKITLAQVSGDRREILTDFYERSVADLPAPMRAFVEDKLLTKSGYRDNLALESALEFPGVTRPLIDTLVGRRLLRIEDRAGIQRVELTHDVLAEVIRASRDTRQQRQLIEETERRERLTRRRMWLARGIAATLLVGLAGVSWIAWRAIRAERAQETLRAQEVVLREREAVLRREAETRQREEARRWSHSDTLQATRLLEEGKTQEGLAFLVHAARIDPENPVVASRLLSTLTTRSFAQPVGNTVQLPAGPDRVNGLKIGLNGRVIAYKGEDEVLRLVNVETGQVEREFKRTPGFRYLGFTDDIVYSFTADGSVVDCYDPATGRKLSRVEHGPEWRMNDLGAGLTVFEYENSFRVSDSRSGELRASFSTEARRNSTEISPDGTRIYVLYDNRNLVRVWSTVDGKPVGPPIADSRRSGTIRNLVPDHSGRLIPIWQDSTIQLHDLATGQPFGPVLMHDTPYGSTTSAEFSPDDSRLVTMASRTVKVWDVRTGQLALPPLVHNEAVQTSRIVGNGRFLYTVARGFARLWDLTTGQVVAEPMRQHPGGVINVTPDGRQLLQIAATGGFSRYRLDANLARPLAIARSEDILGSVWDAEQPTNLTLVGRQRLVRREAATGRETGVVEYPEPISDYVMAENGRVMLVTTAAGAQQAWSLAPEGIRVTPLPGFPAGPEVLPKLNADGTRALVRADVSQDTLVRAGVRQNMILQVWDLRTGTAGPEMALESQFFTHSLNGKFSRDGKYVTAGALNVARAWDVATGRVVFDLKPVVGPVPYVEFSPDGMRIATWVSSRGVILWDAATRKPVGPHLKHRGSSPIITPVGFSKDGRWFMTYSNRGGSVAVWDARTGSQVGTQFEHADDIRPPVFSPDGARILTGSDDGAARLWDTQSGQLIAEPMRHPSGVTSVSFSPDGRFILTRCGDKFDRIWAVPPSNRDRAPDWLLRYATIQAGSRIDESGEMTDAAAELAGWEALRAEVNALPDTAPFAAWGKWLLADSAKRPLAPGFDLTLAEAEARGLVVAPVAALPEEEAPAAPGVLR